MIEIVSTSDLRKVLPDAQARGRFHDGLALDCCVMYGIGTRARIVMSVMVEPSERLLAHSEDRL